MFKYLITLFLLVVSHAASADGVKSYFDNFSNSKGAFGPNMMQGRSRRVTYRHWAANGGGFIFQAAFRSDVARGLVEEHGVYTGNLFSTNYYELKAEFLLGDANADNLAESDNLEKLSLVSKENPAVYLRAKQMVQNWNLEKLYILRNPSSRLAHGFTARGIGGAEFELEYGQLFVSYYIDASKTNVDLLPLVKLVDSSSLVSSNNFTRIRDRATSLYVTYGPEGAKSGYVNRDQLRALKDIRDSIHNQLTPEVLNMIDAYMGRTKSSKGHAELNEIKALITSYFARGVADINHIAKKGKITVVGLAAINVKTPKVDDLLAYANELVENRQRMLSSEVALSEKYIQLAYTSTAASFLFDKTRAYISQNRINGENIKELTGVLYRALYLQGFINEDRFAQGDNASADFDEYEEMYDDLLTEIITNVKTAYAPYTDKWIEVDSHMGDITDYSIRASAVGLFNHILDKMD